MNTAGEKTVTSTVGAIAVMILQKISGDISCAGLHIRYTPICGKSQDIILAIQKSIQEASDFASLQSSSFPGLFLSKSFLYDVSDR